MRALSYLSSCCLIIYFDLVSGGERRRNVSITNGTLYYATGNFRKDGLQLYPPGTFVHADGSIEFTKEGVYGGFGDQYVERRIKVYSSDILRPDGTLDLGVQPTPNFWSRLRQLLTLILWKLFDNIVSTKNRRKKELL